MQIQRKKDMFHNIGEQYSNSNTNTDGQAPKSSSPEKTTSQTIASRNGFIDLAKTFINEYKLNVLPTVENEKRPDSKSWTKYQASFLTDTEIEDIFGAVDKDNIRIGIICGEISGGLEVIDIDNKLGNADAIYKDFQEFPGVKEITCKCVIESSPSGGFHFYYRSSSIEGNKKLASIPKDMAAQDILLKYPELNDFCIIETRGKGGYIVCAPSEGYSLIQGCFGEIPTITQDERELLLSAARSFNKTFKKPKTNFKIKDGGENKPWLLYDQSEEAISECKDLLTKNGWTYLYNKDEQEYWCRPGKSEGVSATFMDNWFYVFTSSAYPFEPDKCYYPSIILYIHILNIGVIARHSGNQRKILRRDLI
jgi:Bifunctional DNA primase/polymerase, N-terminal